MDWYNDLFEPHALMGALANAQYVPGQLKTDGVFAVSGEYGTLLDYLIEPKDEVSYAANAARGAPSKPLALDKWTGQKFTIPSMQPMDIPILADSVLNAGTPDRGRMILTTKRDAAIRKLRRYADLNHEYRRVACVNAPSNALGSAPAAVQLAFGANDASMRGAIFTTITKPMEAALDGLPYTGLVAYCEDTYWVELLKSKTINETYLNYAAAAELRGEPAESFPYGGVLWKRYRAGGGITITSGQAKVIPVGVPDMFLEAYAPDDTVQSVGAGEAGMPYYLNAYPLEEDKGVRIKVSSHPLMICTRPTCVLTLKLTS